MLAALNASALAFAALEALTAESAALITSEILNSWLIVPLRPIRCHARLNNGAIAWLGCSLIAFGDLLNLSAFCGAYGCNSIGASRSQGFLGFLDVSE